MDFGQILIYTTRTSYGRCGSDDGDDGWVGYSGVPECQSRLNGRWQRREKEKGEEERQRGKYCVFSGVLGQFSNAQALGGNPQRFPLSPWSLY
jgi:hypothetical protein